LPGSSTEFLAIRKELKRRRRITNGTAAASRDGQG